MLSKRNTGTEAHSQNPSHSFTQDVLSCCRPSPVFSSYCKQTNKNRLITRPIKRALSESLGFGGRKKKTRAMMTRLSSVKGITWNFKNVPFLSHLTPGQSTSPPGPLSISGFLFLPPPRINPQETCSHHPLPMTPAHSSPHATAGLPVATSC